MRVAAVRMLTLWLIAAASPAPAADSPTAPAPAASQSIQPAAVEKTFDSHGMQRTYYEYAPASLSPDRAAPLFIVLHGSGGRGSYIIRPWLQIASQQGFMVAAPNSLDIMYWKLRDDSPTLFRDMVLAIAREHAIDTRRIYLFGQSGGAVYALTLSALESEFFAATAVHAGSWRESREFDALRFAKRKIPVAIFIGSRDQYFTVKSVKDTEAAFRRHGHPFLVTVIPRHDHDYLDVAEQINPSIWEFVQGVSLPDNPKFQEYD